MVKNYIDGAWLESKAKETVEVMNPSTGKKIDDCPLGNADEVAHAIRAAKEAFKTWRKVPTINRVQPLFKLKHLMEENLEEIAKLVTMEHGKTLVESRGSVSRAIQMLDTACGMPTLMMGEFSEDIATDIDCQAVKRPMGVFAGIAPFNFPVMVPFWFWPFAVASGNTYVLKPSERVPLTQVKIFELMDQCGFPKGVINMVQGGKDVVNALCTHEDIQGVSFVGSTPVAKHVYQTAGALGKRVQALGGAKNTMVVLPDAVMDKAVNTALESIIGCAGERCLAGSVVLSVGDGTYDTVKDRIVAAAQDISVGDGMDPSVQMGPVISAAAKERIVGMIDRAIGEGAKLLVDGRVGVDDLPGFFLRPTVLGDVTSKMEIAREEVFGPVVLLSKAKTFDDAITWVNDSNYANTTTLFTTNGAAARKFSYEVDPSMIGINIGVPAPMAFFSFGGSKDSFYGDIKAHGKTGVNFFTDTKVTIQRWMNDGSIW